ncbi:MAG: tRNA preQ1(34) S-adenosylmethionine ribosyltransferase-isomerase QueA [Nitrospirae bacterium]|nr:tRNA preQ1(34) S-adenosylmethionine ribosyltransferase-isomerase QueA [Nitrospirota bacterium]
MLVSEFDFELPPELIAQTPAPARDGSRLMVLDRETDVLAHRSFTDLPEYLRAGDVLVVNDTMVFPARLEGMKPATGGRMEALLLRELGGGRFEALVRGKAPAGTALIFGGRLPATVAEDLGDGRKLLDFGDIPGLDESIDELGAMPLPPYIEPGGRDASFDRERYQTVYASKRGAVAAPTAGLHFSERLLGRIRGMGVIVVPVTLHVGIGTFLPVREEVVERHGMHEEFYEVGQESTDAINRAKSEGRRVIAVGTTSARTLESASDGAGMVAAGSSGTSIFIYPGYRFKAVDALVTNFHLPKSTLLMLVSAMAGRDRVLAAYAEAIRERYRFFSYGDAMLIL